MFFSLVSQDSLIKSRLEAEYYDPVKINKLKWLDVWKDRSEILENLCEFITDGTHQTPSYVGEGEVFLSGKNIMDGWIDPNDTKFITSSDLVLLEKNKCSPIVGDILLSKNGRIGTASVYQKHHPVCGLFVSVALLRHISQNDPQYLSVVINSALGFDQFVRSSKTGVITNLHLEEIRETVIPLPNEKVQTFIGDKARQSELLRKWTKILRQEIKQSLNSSGLEESVSTKLKKFNTISSSDLSPRLDPKYYGNRALNVFNATKADGVQIKYLIKSIANGFEERSFVKKGVDYITVSEVSSGRLNIINAPKISDQTEIPIKAYVNEKDVLVVRTGSIGTAIKIDKRDAGAVISSHLIKLKFDSESLAASVALFLNSEAGKILQQKISYGAVQPQIGQDELLALSIPKFVLDKQEELFCLNFKLEEIIRTSLILTQTSKTLVESLISEKLSEREIIEAQHGLEEGDNSKDRAILSKLTDKGYLADNGKPLFTDLDKLYELLDEAKQAVDANEESA